MPDQPVFHSPYDQASFLLSLHFTDEQLERLTWNIISLSDPEQDWFCGLILTGDQSAIAEAITGYLRQGVAPLAIADVVNIAQATHAVAHLLRSNACVGHMHSFEYATIVNYWLRNFRNRQQIKAVYLSAWFVADTIQTIDASPELPSIPKVGAACEQEWAAGIVTETILEALQTAIDDQDPARAVALVREWNKRHDPNLPDGRDDLIYALAYYAGQRRQRANPFLNVASLFEEYQLNSASPLRKDVLLEFWACSLSRCYGNGDPAGAIDPHGGYTSHMAIDIA